MGIVWGAAWIATYMYGKELPGTIASFISFGSLVAAGWIGWQRPWLYGFVAALLGYLIFLPYFVAVVAPVVISQGSTPAAVAEFLGINGLMQVAIGTVAGFYGGYLHRRMADPTLRRTAPPARRDGVRITAERQNIRRVVLAAVRPIQRAHARVADEHDSHGAARTPRGDAPQPAGQARHT